MWGWFKRKRPPPNRELDGLLHQFIDPRALAVALAETVQAYALEVKAGRISVPAHRHTEASAVAIWRNLRMETFALLFNHGTADLFLLSEHQRQREVLDCFLDERPHLEMPQPRGQPIPDTLQAVWRAYIHLDSIGSEVGDKDTDQRTLRQEGRSILDELTSKAVALREGWSAFAARQVVTGERQPMPGTMIEAVYEDLTAKTKSIALSAKFGPNPKATIRWLEDRMKEDGASESDLVNFRATVRRVLTAKTPEDCSR